ncbi:MAG: hypothetical protein JNL08_05585 [Planctomycetes bacterium]|nr:hypothetical protein [Planctomycetota bacterium]
MRAAAGIALALLVAACASNEAVHADFDSSAGLVEVVVGGDGWVRCDGERMPWEAAVLRLRQRTRAMSQDELQRFVVHLKAEPQQPGSAAMDTCGRTVNRVLVECERMGVLQVKYL